MPDPAPAPHQRLPPEPRWPAVLGALAVGGLLLCLPESLTLGPTWLLPTVVISLLSASFVCERLGAQTAHTAFGYVVSGVITVALAWSLTFLVDALPKHHLPATSLLRSAGALWLSNILVFASWYWRLDAGGRRSAISGLFMPKAHFFSRRCSPLTPLPGTHGNPASSTISSLHSTRALLFLQQTLRP